MPAYTRHQTTDQQKGIDVGYAANRRPSVSSQQPPKWNGNDAWRTFCRACTGRDAPRPAWVHDVAPHNPRRTRLWNYATITGHSKSVDVKILAEADAVRIYLERHPGTEVIPIAIPAGYSDSVVRTLVYSKVQPFLL